jgi:SAM-dependent methyltransferase
MSDYGSVAKFYDNEYAGFRHDLDFFLDRLLAERVRGPVLEPGCGTGRVVLPIAIAGFQVSGFDSSEAMLRRARRRRASMPADVRLRVDYSRQEMTSFAYPRRFRAAILAFSTLNLLVSEEDRRACLDRLARHLEPGGLLLADLFNPCQPCAGSPAQPRRFESSFRQPPHGHIVTKSVEEIDHSEPDTTSVRYRFQERRDRDDSLVDDIEVEFTLARVHRRQIEVAMYETGFDVEAVYGDYTCRPYTERSPRMILQARRLAL